MNNPTSGVGRALAQGLRLSSDEAFEQEKAREASNTLKHLSMQLDEDFAL